RFAGVPESVPQRTDEDDDVHEFVFDPLPGESLQIAVTRPATVAGSTQAVESVRLQSTVGQRASDYTLDLHLRASQGGERVLGLPKDAELLAVTRNGDALNLRLDGGRLSLPVQPGDNGFEVRFRDAAGIGLHDATPAVTLGLPAANIHLELSLPDSRWI